MLPIDFGRESCGSVAAVVVNSGGGAVEGLCRENGGDGGYFGTE